MSNSDSNGTNGFITDRRALIKGASALGLCLAAPGLYVSRISPAAAAAAPKKGGHFRLAAVGGSTNDTLDPAALTNKYMYLVNFSLRNHLTEIAKDGSLIGELAESWEASPDAKVWTFKLRRGITFHNGKTLDADDVIASINYHRGAQSRSIVKNLAEQIVELRADGKETVTFTLSAGNADWPFILSDFHFGIVPLIGGDLDTQSGVGTGPYVLQRYDAGARTEATRNKDYWKEGHAHFDTIELLNIADGAARQNGLVTGDLHAIGRVDSEIIDLLAGMSNVQVLEVNSTQHFALPMFADTAPFTDNNVRLALKHAIDRTEILEKIIRGHGTLGNDHPIGPTNKYVATDLPQREYDPDAAKFYLQKAGLSTLEVNLSASEGIQAGSVDLALLFSESAKRSGINITVVSEPADSFWSNVYMVKKFIVTPWGGRPTEDWMFSSAYSKEARWNDSHWFNERFEELLVAARAELNEETRREMYREMQLLVRDEGATIIPIFQNEVFATSDEITTNGPLANNWELDGARATERWSFI